MIHPFLINPLLLLCLGKTQKKGVCGQKCSGEGGKKKEEKTNPTKGKNKEKEGGGEGGEGLNTEKYYLTFKNPRSRYVRYNFIYFPGSSEGRGH